MDEGRNKENGQFTKGNKWAKGHGFGRPRRIPETDDELIMLGQELLEWCEEDPENNLTFPLFHTSYGILRNEWKCIIQKPVFIPFYEQAQALLGVSFMNGRINPTISQRFVRKYHPDIAEEENETFKLKAGVITAGMTTADLKEQTIQGMIKQADLLDKSQSS